MSDERGKMTPQQMDELASAYLDGEATPEEAALVEGDPGLQSLVEELRLVRDLIATPVEAPSDEVRDEMIAQALAHRAPVVSLDTARRRMRAIPTRARVILAAAAVVAAFAVVGVTLFGEANHDDDEMFANDSASAPAMAEEPAMDMAESAPASEEESEVAADEVLMDDSDSAAGFAAPAEAMEAPQPTDLEGPEEQSFADDAPADDAEPEPAMADEPAESMQLVEETPLVFDTQEELESYAMQFVDDLYDAQSSDSDESAGLFDSLACPLFEDEEVELLARFMAVVEEIELEVSIYTGPDFAQQELLLVQTSPPPDCAIHGPVTALAWSTSP